MIQAPDGTAYSGYGGFTNFSSPVVQKYNVDLAAAAARGRRRRRPLRLRPPPGRADVDDGRPGPRRRSVDRDHRLPRARPLRAREARHVPRRVRVRDRRNPAGRDRAGRALDRPRGGLRGADGLPVALGPGRVRRRRSRRAAVRDRAAIARRLPARRARHGRAPRPVAPGLLARRRLRPEASARADRRSRRRRHRRVPALGSARHVHDAGARRDGGAPDDGTQEEGDGRSTARRPAAVGLAGRARRRRPAAERAGRSAGDHVPPAERGRRGDTT